MRRNDDRRPITGYHQSPVLPYALLDSRSIRRKSMGDRYEVSTECDRRCAPFGRLVMSARAVYFSSAAMSISTSRTQDVTSTAPGQSSLLMTCKYNQHAFACPPDILLLSFSRDDHDATADIAYDATAYIHNRTTTIYHRVSRACLRQGSLRNDLITESTPLRIRKFHIINKNKSASTARKT